MDKRDALRQIDAVLQECRSLISKGQSNTVPAPETAQLIALIHATINRLAPPGHTYLKEYDRFASTAAARFKSPAAILVGALMALRADYAGDRLRTYRELIHAELFADFLEMAQYFVDEDLKDPAAVIAGGVLEQHLRKLCLNHGVPTSDPKGKNLMTNAMNAALAKQGAYGKIDQQQITAWAAIRNEAAHGNFAKYQQEAVELMIAGIRDFISRNPA